MKAEPIEIVVVSLALRHAGGFGGLSSRKRDGAVPL
jgi:hypothetical protein